MIFNDMEISSFNIYSETLFERKDYRKLVAMKAFLNFLMVETHAVYLYALELILVVCAFSAFREVCHSAKTKNYGRNQIKFEINFPKQSFWN